MLVHVQRIHSGPQTAKIIIMSRQCLRRRYTVTDSRAPHTNQYQRYGACSNENMKYSQILDGNRNVFRAVLKLFTGEELRMAHGRPNWFHADGPATTNARSPNFVLVR